MCELVADNTGEIPFPVLSEFEVIGVIPGHFCRRAFSAPDTIDFGSASHGFSQISPGSMCFVFINEFQPLPGGQATATVGEVGRHHSEQCGMILLVDGQCELVPEISPGFFSHPSASCRSLREGRNSYEQHQQRCKRLKFPSHHFDSREIFQQRGEEEPTQEVFLPILQFLPGSL